MSDQITVMEERGRSALYLLSLVGNDVSYDDLEAMVNAANESSILSLHFIKEIAEYKTKEALVINETDKLYEQVEVFVESCESDIKNSIVPLSVKEAQGILDKQYVVMKDLQQEVAEYQTRTEELKEKIALLQKRNEEMGTQPAPVNSADRESIHQSLLWLYSLKRIINHSIGIMEIQAIDTMVRVTFVGE